MKSAPVCCELMELLDYLRFPAQNSIGWNEDPFSAGCLAPIPMSALCVCRHYDLRMRINLQHPGCFRLAAICVKNVFY